MGATDSFYADLPEFSAFVEVADPKHYRPAPADWLVVITDVIGSTKAIEAGRYKDVNSLGVASIVALRNALQDLEIAYVFGGDGATILLPEGHRAEVDAALRGIREMARTAFEMDMRASAVSVGELRGDGHDVLVARYRASPHICLAMFGGSGLSEAERRVKDPTDGAKYAVAESGPSHADFTGFECRWQEIPGKRGNVASVLVQARSEDRAEANQVYEAVVRRIEAIVDGEGQPVDPSNLNLQGAAGDFDAEARIRSGARGGAGFLMRRFIAKTSARIGTVLLDRCRDALGFPGSVYRGEVVANTDFRKFDDTLRMVLDLSSDQLAELRTFLAEEHAANRLVYGVHVAEASLMTCAIRAYHGDHVHFVDGADGGYALAAKQMKAQLRA